MVLSFQLVEKYWFFKEMKLWYLLGCSSDITKIPTTICTSKRFTHFNGLPLFYEESEITSVFNTSSELKVIFEIFYLKYFGASNIKTTVLPMLN